MQFKGFGLIFCFILFLNFLPVHATLIYNGSFESDINTGTQNWFFVIPCEGCGVNSYTYSSYGASLGSRSLKLHSEGWGAPDTVLKNTQIINKQATVSFTLDLNLSTYNGGGASALTVYVSDCNSTGGNCTDGNNLNYTGNNITHYSFVKSQNGLIEIKFNCHSSDCQGNYLNYTSFYWDNFQINTIDYNFTLANLSHTPEPASIGQQVYVNGTTGSTVSRLKCGYADANSFTLCNGSIDSNAPYCSFNFQELGDLNLQCMAYTADGLGTSNILYNYISNSGQDINTSSGLTYPVAIYLSLNADASIKPFAKAESGTFESAAGRIYGYVDITDISSLDKYTVPACNYSYNCIINLKPNNSYLLEYADSTTHLKQSMTFKTGVVVPYYEKAPQNIYAVLPITRFNLTFNDLAANAFKCPSSSIIGFWDLGIANESPPHETILANAGCLSSANQTPQEYYFFPTLQLFGTSTDASSSVLYDLNSNKQLRMGGSIYGTVPPLQNYGFTIINPIGNPTFIIGNKANITVYTNGFISSSVESGTDSDFYAFSPSINNTSRLKTVISPNTSTTCNFTLMPSRKQNISEIDFYLLDDNHNVIYSNIDTSGVLYSYNPLGYNYSVNVPIPSNYYGKYNDVYCTARFKQADNYLSSFSEFTDIALYSDSNGTATFKVVNNQYVPYSNLNVLSYNGHYGVVHLTNSDGSISRDLNLYQTLTYNLGIDTYTLTYKNELTGIINTLKFVINVHGLNNIYIIITANNNLNPVATIWDFKQETPYLTCEGIAYDNDADLTYLSVRLYDSNHTFTNPNYRLDSNDISYYNALVASGVIDASATVFPSSNSNFNLCVAPIFSVPDSYFIPCVFHANLFLSALTFKNSDNITCGVYAQDLNNHSFFTSSNLIYSQQSKYNNIICSADYYGALDSAGWGHTDYTSDKDIPISCKICYDNTSYPLKNMQVKWHDLDLNFITFKQLDNYSFCDYYGTFSPAGTLPVGTYSNERVDINSIIGNTFAIIPSFKVLSSEGGTDTQQQEQQTQINALCAANVGGTSAGYQSTCTSGLCLMFKSTSNNFTCFIWGIVFGITNNFIGFIINSFIVIIFLFIILILWNQATRKG